MPPRPPRPGGPGRPPRPHGPRPNRPPPPGRHRPAALVGAQRSTGRGWLIWAGLGCGLLFFGGGLVSAVIFALAR